MIHSPDIHAPVLGFVAAAFSTGSLWISQLADAPGWLELGGTLGLIGGLSYGCVTLWQALQDQRKESHAEREAAADRAAAERREFIAAKDALELEIRSDWKNQNAKLISVLEKLDPDS
jgi:hypothetical protein